MTDPRAEIQKIEEDIHRLEEFKQKGVLPADLADAGIDALKKQLTTYRTEVQASGAIAQGDSAIAVGEQGIGISGSVHGDVLGAGATKVEQYFYGEKITKSILLPEALQNYLDNLIATHQHLRLQGIRAGNQLVSMSLEKVYVSLTAMDTHTSSARAGIRSSIGTLTIDEALRSYNRLVIIGDPGCGKTTLLSYLALTYARTLRGNVDLVKFRLGFSEADNLPILLPLRDLGRHLLETVSNPGKDGPAILLDYLLDYYRSQEIDLPADFFSIYLEKGHATLLLDGMDEVADSTLRQRVARLIEKFSERYPKCRFIVTSREVGYEGAARIGAQFGLVKVRDFSPDQVHQFIRDWTHVVEVTLAQSNALEVLRLADAQADKLISAIDTNPRVADLAVNPLLLTVIALVHRYRAQLPERRSELYEEVIEVLLGNWDEAKGLEQEVKVAGIQMDSGDRRSLLEPVAFWMHGRNQREIERDDLRALLLPTFKGIVGIDGGAGKALDDFLRVVNERSGLLIERGIGMYGFAHLTFQEYLAARVLADRKDALDFTVKHMSDIWWREVILLQAGYLSTQGKRRVSELISVLMNADSKNEPEPHHNLLLAAECLFDVGPARVDRDLLGELRKRMKRQADAPLKLDNKASVLAKITASNALARLESGQVVSHFWKPPYGEPEWVTIPSGEFWMGSDDEDDEKPVHKIALPEYQIARVPITNAQYALYVQDAKVRVPKDWRGGDVPPGFENHPVVFVSWDETLAYCEWLGEKIQKSVTLPSEAEWEKAARGSMDKRSYPWGDEWCELHCNSYELGLNDTTPVGLFLNGASPYGLLDMSGNVWEWTRSIWNSRFKYPYQSSDGREDLRSNDTRVQRGGSFAVRSNLERCSFRDGFNPSSGNWGDGFRVVILSRSTE